MAKILSIKELLQIRGLDTTKKIKLVRHKDKRETVNVYGVKKEGNPYTWYRNDMDTFLKYQSEQTKDVYKGVDYIVSFIGEEGTTARFVGVYRIEGYAEEKPVVGSVYYKISHDERFVDLEERVIIDWGNSALSWHQWLCDKEVIEIVPGFDAIFPGYSQVVLRLTQMQTVLNYPLWKKMLQAVNCIYVITDLNTGKLYIGSTYNKEGIYGRWNEYVRTQGHGGNTELIKLLNNDPDYGRKYFQWSILELLSLNIARTEAIKTECLFKKKLGSLAFGLNNN